MFILQFILILGFLLLRTLTIAAGLIVIPLSLIFKWTKDGYSFTHPDKKIKLLKYDWLLPWNNLEDGIVAGEEFIGPDTFNFSILGFDLAFTVKKYPEWFRTLYWSCIRNPANGLRFIPLFSFKIDPKKVKFKMYIDPIDQTFTEKSAAERNFLYEAEEGKIGYMMDDVDPNRSFWYVASHGLYSNFRLEMKLWKYYYRFWIGWKIYPSDKFGVSSTDYRAQGVGFATQFKKLRDQENQGVNWPLGLTVALFIVTLTVWGYHVLL